MYIFECFLLQFQNLYYISDIMFSSMCRDHLVLMDRMELVVLMEHPYVDYICNIKYTFSCLTV